MAETTPMIPNVTNTSASVKAGAEPRLRPPPELFEILSFCPPFVYIHNNYTIFYVVIQ